MQIARAPALIALLAFLAGCGAGPARAPNATRLLDERRAIEVIRRAVSAEGARPGGPRDVELVNGATLHVDVSVADKQYGIAYVTTDEARELGNSIPVRNQKDEKLKIAPAGETGMTKIVLLYQVNYLYDDLAGEEHEQTAITCERYLTRDVQDFITYARAKKFE
jgi:hypothetical protein